MGNTSYNFSSRSLRSVSMGYDTVTTATMDSVFTQNRERKAHETMKPQGAKIREARDSDTHPYTVPIILALDVTGSMRSIPVHLIKEGLPKMVSAIIQAGIPDPALLFTAVGDHECDSEPLQVGQFESGDAELDMWLTRTYVEGGGGGNAGESYPLTWYFAAKHTVTDAWEKRQEKGFLITIGDEPFLNKFPLTALNYLMPMDQKGTGSLTASQLYEMASEKWNIWHLHMGEHGPMPYGWKELLGQRAIELASYNDVPKTVAELIVDNANYARRGAPIVLGTGMDHETTIDTPTDN